MDLVPALFWVPLGHFQQAQAPVKICCVWWRCLWPLDCSPAASEISANPSCLCAAAKALGMSFGRGPCTSEGPVAASPGTAKRATTEVAELEPGGFVCGKTRVALRQVLGMVVPFGAYGPHTDLLAEREM